jgi:hypothetical protein
MNATEKEMSSDSTFLCLMGSSNLMRFNTGECLAMSKFKRSSTRHQILFLLSTCLSREFPSRLQCQLNNTCICSKQVHIRASSTVVLNKLLF